MKRNSIISKAILLALSSAAISQANAAGFQVNEHSTNGLGRAMAGQAAMPENASVLATNPAAISVFERSQLSASLSYIDPDIDIKGEITTNLSPMSVPATMEDFADHAFVPAFFYVSPLNDKLSYGVGMFTTYGLTSDYSDEFNGLHFADKAEVLSVTFNPAISYKVLDNLSLGFGLAIIYSDAEIGTSTPMVIESLTGGAVPGNVTIVKMQGDDWATSWNAGAFWQLSSATDIALSYRAKTELTMEGSIESALVQNYNQKGKLDLGFAAVTELAVNHRINSEWSVQAGANLTEWSTFDKLEANLVDGSQVLLKEENFEDSWRYSLGLTYQYSSGLTLRAGYAIDQGAVSDENRSLSIPDTDRQWHSAGFTYQLPNGWSADAAYVYISGDDATVNETSQVGAIVSELSATQHASAQIFSLQLNRGF
jgi:long-chain fatty acid transport protein